MPARRRVVAASGLALLALLISAPADAANGARNADRTTSTTERAPRRSTTTVTDAPPDTSTTRRTTSTTAAHEPTPGSTTPATSTAHATSSDRHDSQSSSSTTSTTSKPKSGKRYVVVLKKGNSSRAVADDHAKSKHVKVEHVFGSALRGYAADIPDNEVNAVKHDKRVAYVERDKTMRTYAQILPWGVDKVSHIGSDYSSTHPGDGTGTVSMNVYILDSGIQANPDLNGATEYSAVGGGLTDCAGHGTFVSGVVGAKDDTQGVVGVAPGVALHGVRVLDCQGRGTTTSVVAGLDWIVAHGIHGSVIQMSFGSSSIDQAFDDSITRAVNAGFVITDAAGNDHVNACKQSPAHMGTVNGVITVGASTRQDGRAAFSNFGSCVDIWAPGTNIISDYLNGQLAKASGTSVSAPHVAGIAALYLSQHAGASPSTVEAAIKSAAVNLGTKARPILRASAAAF